MKTILFVFIVICILVNGESVDLRENERKRDNKCGKNLTYSISGTELRVRGTGEMDDGGGLWAVYEHTIETIVIEEGVTSIGDDAFSLFDKLKSVSLPESLLSIGDYAFFECVDLKEVRIPKRVAFIGKEAFWVCTSLTSFEVEQGNMHFKSVNGVLYDYEQTKIIQYPSGKSDSSYTILTGVKTIGEYAFFSCLNLTDVVIPDGVTSIENRAFFECRNLKNPTIPDSVISIDIYAFCDCDEITRIIIPAGVKSIGPCAFCCGDKLTSIEVEDENTDFVSIDGVLFNFNRTIIIQYPEGKKGSSYTIPDGVISIGNHCFSSCESLTKVIIPGGVKLIGDWAFHSTDLKDIFIPNSVTSIGEYAFSYCSRLTYVTIPESVSSIKQFAFTKCLSLASVFYQGSHNISTPNVFSDCNKLNTVCVSPDYDYSLFCDVAVNSSSGLCQSFQGLFDKCFLPTFSNDNFVRQKRRSAIEWEAQTNGCIQYQCNNETGLISWSLCNSTNEETRICVNSLCVENDSMNKGFAVVIDMKIGAVKVSDVNTTEVLVELSSETGVSVDVMTIGLEINDDYVIRIIVYVDDELTANTISEVVDAMDTGKNCNHGVLCSKSAVHVVGIGELSGTLTLHHNLRTVFMVFSIMCLLFVILV